MMISPTYCAASSTLSLTLRPEIISQKVKIACPPSSPGIGRMFITARMIDRKAVFIQKSCQSHCEGKMLPIEMNPPSSSYILVLGCTMSLSCSQ